MLTLDLLNRIIRVNCFVALSTLSAAGAHATPYFVAPNGSDTNPGTQGSPWKTIFRAIAVAKAGDTVYFRAGDYPIDRMIYIKQNAGEPGKPITYASYDKEPATLTWTRMAPIADETSRNILFVARPYYVFERLTFRQASDSRAYALSIGQPNSGVSIWADHVTLRECSVLNPSGLGVYVNGSSVLVERSTIKGMNHGHAFYIAGADGIYRDNHLDCGGATLPGHGQCLQFQYATSMRNKAYGNLVLNAPQAGVVFSGPATNNEVFNNIFVNPGSDERSKSGWGLMFWCEKGALGLGNKFYNNTLIGKTYTGLIDTRIGIPGASCSSTSGGQPLAARVEIRNNIFYPSQPPSRELTAISTIRDNIFFNLNGAVPPGNKLLNPKLVNYLGKTAADARLTDGSPAIDAVISGAPDVDYFKSKRPGGIRADVGAHEFNGSTPTPRSPLQLDVR